ncbi:uncharacterized protein LOC117178670 [Belonocnema kinseyi]|uniref:uncharacterized protein LOC117178670 n=1 Tax=Belonocnema kinseyi TaxID=2817044 RepID=UPI00143DBEBF|nr:uncharacterized protein LOC117178670 [Belonocnema kinseyi]
MELVSNPDELISTQGYFLPHHCVIKETSSSTKLRPAFNASQGTDLGISLNEVLHSGPKLQTELLDVILRWRCYPIVFTAGIEKMFRRIWIYPEECTYQKILWKSHPDEELNTYCLKTVTFGFASAPYLGIRTLHQLTDDEGNNFPLATDILRNEINVNDFLSGAYEFDTTIEKRRQVSLLLKAGGFILRKWLSNCEDVLQGVLEDYKEKASSYEFTQETIHRALGIL